jgi:ABC-type phosphate transport system ATPase subunit
MSKVQKIKTAIAKLSQKELQELREWLEDKLVLTDEVKAKLDESRAQIGFGQCRTRQP